MRISELPKLLVGAFCMLAVVGGSEAVDTSFKPDADFVCDGDGTLNPEKLLTWGLYIYTTKNGKSIPPGLVSRSFELRDTYLAKKQADKEGKVYTIPPPLQPSDLLPTAEQMAAMNRPGFCGDVRV